MNPASTHPWARHMPVAEASGSNHPAGPEGMLRDLYERYCRSQAAQLLGIIPREAVRPLYRAARDARPDPSGDRDPMVLLANHCASLLPLPPFAVWKQDFQDHRMAYLEDMSLAPGGGGPPLGPLPMDTRVVLLGHTAWSASLYLFRDDDVWRGFISFAPRDDGSAHTGGSPPASVRTADIFQEGEPEEVLARFREFAPPALKAFLRSSLP